MGLGSGGRVNNVILLNEEEVVNTTLRFPDEFVRHKVLDLIGDIYLLNRPIIGKISAKQTGHLENILWSKNFRRFPYHKTADDKLSNALNIVPRENRQGCLH